ncbi:TetR/AcrR family transcriptional regulator [Streptomyces avidinii]|uniref:AcrR family transcriptional regulator n=1 Tax=Streptomyces avidinii TaxID=1895 RepID=A0ABS4KZU3_STRAV|nr:TetR/AcrR family transcriptional regulator [Streptomyces avidinii]MBP2035165.1 AcrR family transcriptional regulator [Streptomyces avidinii]GGY91664.1 TetR family transcriptional regulator [Streptomyces avidinii]
MATPSSKAGTKGVPRERRRRQMLEAATEEFGRHGYAAASLPAIAARVGVTKTLLHQYLGSKEDLYVACLVPVGDRLLGAVREAMGEGGTAPHTPLRVLHGIFTALEGRREAWFVLYDTTLPPGGEAARRASEYWAAIDRLAAGGTAELLSAAGSTDPLDADALKYVWRDLVATLVRWWVKHPEQTPEAMTQRCARLFAAAATLTPEGRSA